MRAIRVLSVSITLASASLLCLAQTFNEVQVNLPYAITTGTKVVPAGNYEIRPIADQSDTFGFYKDGVICESIVHATRIQKSGSDVDTSLVLKSTGDRYQLSQMWIDGQTGYQFYSPNSVKVRDNERSLTIKAHHN